MWIWSLLSRSMNTGNSYTFHPMREVNSSFFLWHCFVWDGTDNDRIVSVHVFSDERWHNQKIGIFASARSVWDFVRPDQPFDNIRYCYRPAASICVVEDNGPVWLSCDIMWDNGTFSTKLFPKLYLVIGWSWESYGRNQELLQQHSNPCTWK